MDAPLGEPRTWSARHVKLAVDGRLVRLRMVRFPRGWVASADSVVGPTLGADRSPYLAARQALEPLGIGLVAALAAVGRLDDQGQ
jgi:hypothetical protein